MQVTTEFDFCFSEPGVVLIPLEHLTQAGISDRFMIELSEREVKGDIAMDSAWMQVFNHSFQTYWSRTKALSSRSPGDWLPPRCQHVVVVTDSERTRPFFQPLYAASWMVYASDFDPKHSNAEFGAFILVHSERLGIDHDLVVAVVQNLSYWIDTTQEQRSAFMAASHAACRPDASGFRAIAEALDWLHQIHHVYLRPPEEILVASLTPLPRTHLLLSASEHRRLEEMLKHWVETAPVVARSFYEKWSSGRGDHAQEIVAWLKKRRPQLVVTDQDQKVLWSAARPKTGKLKAALSDLSRSTAKSMIQDLDIIDRRSRQFLGSLSDARTLPEVHEESATPGGLSYMHRELKRVAYNIHEMNNQRLREPSPPYERLMLGARTIHEWCHLAVDAQWVPVKDQARHEQVFDALVDCYAKVLAGLPQELREPAETELGALPASKGNPARALAMLPMERMTDYQSNLLAAEYLPTAEMQVYVRNNVHTLAFDRQTTGLLSRLARYAFEIHYLGFVPIAQPRAYVLSSTWIGEQYFEPGLITPENYDELCRLTGELCDNHVVDRARFKPA